MNDKQPSRASDKFVDLPKRFWDKVDKSTEGCWNWLSCTDAGGYAEFFWHGRATKASRLIFAWANGGVPNGLFVLHTCDNRRCVNPGHLYAGTHRDNMNDMAARTAARKLSPDQVQEILYQYDVLGKTQVELGMQYQVDHVAIGQLLRGQTWSWLTGRSHTPRKRVDVPVHAEE